MFYQTPGYGYGNYGCMPMYQCGCNTNRRSGSSYALILVLFIFTPLGMYSFFLFLKNTFLFNLFTSLFETQIKKCHIRISNLRSNSIHQYTTKLVKLNPSHIIIEDLNVSGMMKNRHLSKKIVHCSFYEIRRQLEYKCLNNGIELIVADRWFPSTKTCSCCGSVKDKMSLSQRTYSCDECGIELDRDFNASLNLKNLAISQ